jgi:hypothetical protein
LPGAGVPVISSLADYDYDATATATATTTATATATATARRGRRVAGAGGGLEDRAAEEEAAKGEEHGALTVPRGGLQAAVFEKDDDRVVRDAGLAGGGGELSTCCTTPGSWRWGEVRRRSKLGLLKVADFFNEESNDE